MNHTIKDFFKKLFTCKENKIINLLQNLGQGGEGAAGQENVQ